jgi:hypothetical protein
MESLWDLEQGGNEVSVSLGGAYVRKKGRHTKCEALSNGSGGYDLNRREDEQRWVDGIGATRRFNAPMVEKMKA